MTAPKENDIDNQSWREAWMGGQRIPSHRRSSACGSARPGGSRQQSWISAGAQLRPGSQIRSRWEASGRKWERNKVLSRPISSRGERIKGTTSATRRHNGNRRAVSAESGSQRRGRKPPARGCCISNQRRDATGRVGFLSGLPASVFVRAVNVLCPIEAFFTVKFAPSPHPQLPQTLGSIPDSLTHPPQICSESVGYRFSHHPLPSPPPPSARRQLPEPPQPSA